MCLREANSGLEIPIQIHGGTSITKASDEFLVEAEMEGSSAKDLNRALLSALRRVAKKTRLRAEWTSSNNNTERFFDHVWKKTIQN